ncbi:MAG: hypothetical protein M3174_01510 [Actinomycetota bacterium]|nr:hypothetical protein [Actinomycetota bacterium]
MAQARRVRPHPRRPQELPSGDGRNKAVDAVRKQETYERALRKVDPGPELFSPTDPVDERHGIEAALRQLSHLQREALVLAYYGGLTYREVAGRLGVPEGTAKTRLHDGLHNLRRVLGASARS